jgi:hypothetical protein
MKPIRLDPAIVKHQIDNLLAQWPELAEDEQLRADSIEGETDAFEFLRAIEMKRRDALSLSGAVATTIAELELRLGRFERREQAMRDMMRKIMAVADLQKVELPEATLSMRAGSRKLIGEADPDLMPDQFVKVERKLNRAAIKQAIEGGATVVGFELSSGEPTLAIRSK